jgi:hypothetical protein
MLLEGAPSMSLGAVRRPAARGSIPRLTASVFAIAILLLYIQQRVAGSFQPGRDLGLSFGLVATGLLGLCVLLGLRRRAPRWFARRRFGSAATWHRVHLWGGGLFVVSFLLHSGMRWPSGDLTSLLFALSLWTGLSGLFGLVLQRWIPRALTSALRVEVLYERIPELIAELRGRAESLVVVAEKPIRDLYQLQLAPLMLGPQPRWSYHLDITGGVQRHARSIHYLMPLLDGASQRTLREIEELVRLKMELDAHASLQRSLRLWLWLHVPTSLLLCGLVTVHIAAYFVY